MYASISLKNKNFNCLINSCRFSLQLFSLTHVFWATSFHSDYRKTIVPEISITYNYTDYTTGHDPWLKAINKTRNYSINKQKPRTELRAVLIGEYLIAGQKVILFEEAGSLYLKIDRKIKSLFELKTELHYIKEGILETDIHGLHINYKLYENSSPILKFNWFGNTLE